MMQNNKYKLNSNPDKNRTKASQKHKKPDKIYDFKEADDRLFDIFRNHEFEHISHEVRHQLVKFYQILMKNQMDENFTRLTRFRDIAIKHFIDCLIISQLTKLDFPLMDVGTGPGFPGVPLQILYPNEEVILVEGVTKRVKFLKKLREELELKNLNIIGRHMGLDFEYPSKSIITRALSDIGRTLFLCSNSLQVSGKIYFMKGPNAKQESKSAALRFKGYYELEDYIEYDLPKTNYKRSLVIYKKLKILPKEKFAGLYENHRV